MLAAIASHCGAAILAILGIAGGGVLSTAGLAVFGIAAGFAILCGTPLDVMDLAAFHGGYAVGGLTLAAGHGVVVVLFFRALCLRDWIMRATSATRLGVRLCRAGRSSLLRGEWQPGGKSEHQDNS